MFKSFLGRWTRRRRARSSEPSVSGDFRAKLQAAVEAESRHEQTGDDTTLSGAIDAWERVVSDPAFRQLQDEVSIGVLNQLALLRFDRHGSGGRQDDAEAAIRYWRAALDQASPTWEDRWGLLGNALPEVLAYRRCSWH